MASVVDVLEKLIHHSPMSEADKVDAFAAISNEYAKHESRADLSDAEKENLRAPVDLLSKAPKGIFALTEDDFNAMVNKAVEKRIAALADSKPQTETVPATEDRLAAMQAQLDNLLAAQGGGQQDVANAEPVTKAKTSTAKKSE